MLALGLVAESVAVTELFVVVVANVVVVAQAPKWVQKAEWRGSSLVKWGSGQKAEQTIQEGEEGEEGKEPEGEPEG